LSASPSFSGTVATVNDPNALDQGSEYSATIDWGDGQTSSGVVTGSGGSINVSGSHTYTSLPTSPPDNVTVTIIDGDGGVQVVTDSMAVTLEKAITGSATDVSATEGSNTGTTQVATFNDPDTSAVPGDYSVSINWGDGTGADTSTGAITEPVPGSGNFVVTGNHTYAEAGSFTITVTITDADNGSNSISPSSTATVSGGVLSSTGVATFGSPSGFSGTVANFTDSDLSATTGDFSVSIDWGDGVTTGGTISGSGGSFSVSGSHVYGFGGTFNVTVTIMDDDGQTTIANSTIRIGH
jgi:hypothetical protein